MIDQATRDYAKEGDGYYDEYWSGATGWKPPEGLDDDLRQWLDPLLVRGHTVLDVGCGDGARYGARLHDSGLTVHGVDISSVAVAEARKRGIDARVACLDSGLPYPDASFDAVICLEVLEHLVNPEAVAREIRRVLKPGGHAALAVWDTRERNIWAQIPTAALVELGHAEPPDPDVPGPFSLAEDGRLAELLDDAGFVDVEVVPVNLERHYASAQDIVAESVNCSPSFGVKWHELTEAQQDEVANRMIAAVAPYSAPDGSVTLPGVSLVARASA